MPNTISNDLQPSPALVVVDVQNAFLPFMCGEDLRIGPETINWAIRIFRQHGRPVIRVAHTDPTWGTPEGSVGFEGSERVHLTGSDPVMVKRHPSAFKKTDLDSLLKSREINVLFIAGLSATGCVLAMYRAADDLDYKTFLVKDAVVSPKARHTEVVQEFCSTMDCQAIELLLCASSK
jgi:nicotinamidase-related amidase